MTKLGCHLNSESAELSTFIKDIIHFANFMKLDFHDLIPGFPGEFLLALYRVNWQVDGNKGLVMPLYFNE